MTRVKRDKMALVYKLIQQWLFLASFSCASFSLGPAPLPPFLLTLKTLEEYARIRRVERSLFVDVPRLEIDPET